MELRETLGEQVDTTATFTVLNNEESREATGDDLLVEVESDGTPAGEQLQAWVQASESQIIPLSFYRSPCSKWRQKYV